MSSPDTFAVATEAELYAEVARAWCRMTPTGAHVARPIQPYAIGPAFADQLWNLREDYAQQIVAICARLVARVDISPSPVPQTEYVADSPRGALDPVSAWWQPLENPPGVGVHYWILGNGTVELRSVASLDAAPQPDYGRVVAPQQ